MPSDNEYSGDERLTRFTHPVTNEIVETFQGYYPSYLSYDYWKLTYSKKIDLEFLESSLIFIGDIDDLSFDWESVIPQFPNLKFRFYRTYKGFRFFVTNRYLSLFIGDNQNIVHNLFNSFNCDPNYVNQVWLNHRFAARLTPKKGRQECRICTLLYEDQDLSEMKIGMEQAIKIHDIYCL